ncbi:MAG: IRE (iron responsive element), partial [Planctomycetota bacterium]
MNQRRSFYRKIAYGGAMAVLLIFLSMLSLPSTYGKDDGGKLAELRNKYELSQGNLGEVDPASETIKLATLGLRGIAVQRLWAYAFEMKKTENWSEFSATLEL